MDFEKLYKVLPKDPIKWTIEDVGVWLGFIGLGSHFDSFKQATIDGACLTQITDEDLKNDLGVSSGIIRKKIMNWLSVGINGYSQFIQKLAGKMDQEQIAMCDMPFNVFSKQSLENEFRNKNQQIILDNTNISIKQSSMMIEHNENIYEMMTHNIKVENNNNNNNFVVEPMQSQNILTENNLICNKQPSNQVPTELLPNEKPLVNRKSEEEIKELDFEQNEQQIQNKSHELIIQPSEGPQTNFYCINEKGGKIGRHSTNQILILEESISRFHAEIIFNNNEFYLKDIGSTTGTFIKIVDKQIMQIGMIIEMGSNQFVVESMKNATVNLTIIEGPNQGNTYNLIFDDRSQPYSIGRKQNNEICLTEDHHLSNIHARIYYLEKQFVLEDLSSTNGSWQRLSKEGQNSQPYLLQDKQIFKIGTTTTYICKKNQVVISNEQEKVYDNVCVICCESDRDALYLPCKHNTACVRCSKNLRECPICRVKIEEFIKIYKA